MYSRPYMQFRLLSALCMLLYVCVASHRVSPSSILCESFSFWFFLVGKYVVLSVLLYSPRLVMVESSQSHVLFLFTRAYISPSSSSSSSSPAAAAVSASDGWSRINYVHQLLSSICGLIEIDKRTELAIGNAPALQYRRACRRRARWRR